MNIIALDPGTTTGAVFWNGTVYETKQLSTGLDAVWFYIKGKRPDIIVCESFLYQSGRNKVVLDPVEVIGVVKLYCLQEACKLVMQTPAMGKKFWTDDKIKKLRLWKEGQKHAMDAMRHLLHYRAFQLGHNDLFLALK